MSKATDLLGDEEVKTIKFDRQTPDPRVYVSGTYYVPVEPLSDVNSLDDVSKQITAFGVEDVVMKPKDVLFELQACISEYELAVGADAVAKTYNPMRPRNWNKIIIAAIGNEVTSVKIGDEVRLSELNRLHQVDISLNAHGMANSAIAISKRKVITGVTSSRMTYYLVKEYVVGTEDAVLLIINNGRK